MEIKDYVKQFRDLQKSHKKVRVADFCRENMLDYYEMVEALKQEKFASESEIEEVQCGDLLITEVPDSSDSIQSQSLPENYSYVLHEDPWSGTVFIFMNRRHNQLRVFYYERGGFVISEKKLDRQYKFLTPRFDVKKQTYSICWADLVSLLEDKQLRRLYLREAA